MSKNDRKITFTYNPDDDTISYDCDKNFPVFALIACLFKLTEACSEVGTFLSYLQDTEGKIN